MMEADEDGLALLTTEKDRARMTGDPLLAVLAQRSHVLPVTMVMDETESLKRAILDAARR
jgi:tetraacyldisaccharide 4'-kinase